MNKPKGVSWSWRRLIPATEEAQWLARLETCPQAPFPWSITSRAKRKRLVLNAYLPRHADALSLQRSLGGKIVTLRQEDWLQQPPAPALKIGRNLLVVHDAAPWNRAPKIEQPRLLHIPQGLAFGSGEHGTTLMLLRALAAHRGLSDLRLLDLGTGSGILALVARRMGAKEIVATDFDAEAIRTARQNERLNFPDLKIAWSIHDVLKDHMLQPPFSLVLANLYSGILISAATRIFSCVSPGGELWLSGILRDQAEEVVTAYHQLGWQHIATKRQGKWVMLQGSKPAAATRRSHRKNRPVRLLLKAPAADRSTPKP